MMGKSTKSLVLRGEKALLVLLFAVMTAVSIFQVLNRNLFHFTIGWTEEVARFCQVWVALLGTQIGLRTGGQMSIQVVTSRLKGLPLKVVSVAADIVVLLFCVVVVWYSVELMGVQIRSGQVSTALKIPMTIPYAAMLCCFAAMTVGQLGKIRGHLAGGKIETDANEASSL